MLPQAERRRLNKFRQILFSLQHIPFQRGKVKRSHIGFIMKSNMASLLFYRL